MTEFYLRLNNDYSRNIFALNTAGNFKVLLPLTLDLNEKWKVALIDITLPRHTPLKHDSKEYKIRYSNAPGPWKTLIIQFDIYNQITDILYAINKLFLNDGDNVFDLKYNKRMKRIVFKGLKTNKGAIWFSKDIATKLGFSKEIMLLLSSEYVIIGDRKPQLHDDITQLFFIYLDVVKNQMVGDTYAPLLRIVKRAPDSFHFQKSFKNPYYVKLAKHNFNIIEINIRDASGNLVSFDKGTSNITLHFINSDPHG